MRHFILSYTRRHHTGIYTATLKATSDWDARDRVVEFERSRGFAVHRFTDEPEQPRPIT